MARPGTHNLECPQGDELLVTWTFTQGGVPINASGWTVAAATRRTVNDPDVQTFAVDMTQAASGIIVTTLTPTQTLAMKLGDWRYDVQRTSPNKRTLVRGVLSIDDQITTT